MKHLLKIVLILSFIFADNHYTKCGLIHEINQEQRCNPRPEMDTYAPSPNNIFYIHYDLTGNDAPSQSDNNFNGIPDYVDEVGIAAEYSLDVIVNQLGFETFFPDDDGIYDIYIQDMGPGYYGVNWLDVDDDCVNLGGSSWIEIDNEYEQGEYYTTGLDGMRVTVIHEFFHAIQRSYQIHATSNQAFLYELTSTWVEDIAYPDNNDYIYWTDTFFDNPELSISQTDGYSIALYGHYLSSEFNSNIIKEIWERLSILNHGVNSINYVLDNNYNTNFINTWVDFCSKNFFNGEYIDMNNNFYYYADQVYAEPITFNTYEELDGNTSIKKLILDNESIRIKSFQPNCNLILDNMHSTITAGSGTLFGNIILSSDFLENQNIVDINTTGLLIPVEQMYMVLASTHSNTIADIDISVTIDSDNIIDIDFNQDCQTSILDLIILVDVIMENYNGVQDIPNEFKKDCDLNEDGQINIQDCILLKDNEIMDI